ncbi:metal-dependent hydrolase [Natronorubrum texcoconense]|uniref:LexA-binding, inner membrane-associated putative hydrolase n=1 Tax=Natronorubrum texcoconense TaxID=1095776 RepID=A0A1G8XVR2_9EURY|nr:metal-dependent hydrolase [Natronorubrum texcoconense]SDJ94566.1 LexA-binding, inner membrane-associated putative hydrolase [Natronorubrum texcoconense]
MQPVVHLAVGYLCYAAYTRWQHGREPADLPALVAVFAAGLADFIDKPLEAAGVVPVGRTIGHSLLFVVPLVLLVWVVASRRDRRSLGVAFAIGYLSHIATDVPWHVLSGDFDELGFLLWPVTEMPAYTGVKPLGIVGGVEITTLWLEAVILAAAVALWWMDGRPGVDLFRPSRRT